MALSGSLNFISASEHGSYAHGSGQAFGTSDSTEVGFLPTDFAGINSNIYEPITSSDNFLGYSTDAKLVATAPSDSSYLNSGTPTAAGTGLLVGYVGTPPEAEIFNSLMLHRNGPYQHPSWKQIRGGDHPVAKSLRLHNTMSIDASDPDPAVRNKRILLERYEEEKIYPIGSDAKYQVVNTTQPSLKHYYEPSVTKQHKPFIYTVPLPIRQGKVRSTLMNQMVFFENKELNDHMKIAGSDRTTGSYQGMRRPKQQYYEFIQAAIDAGATNFIYAQTIFPKSINTFRTYKVERPVYEEVPGYGSNGYDRTINRSFWKDSQPALAQNIGSDGTTRARTVDSALNSQDVTQSMHLSGNWGVYSGETSTDPYHLEIHRYIISPTTNPDWNATQVFIQNGIIAHSVTASVTGTLGADHLPIIAPSSAFAPLEAYQTYPISLTSMWPLDPRPDIYDKPGYLTSSIGGKGLQIGVTPHRMKEHDGTSLYITTNPFFTASLSSSAYYLDPNSDWIGSPADGDGVDYGVYATGSEAYLQFENILTGTAGELVYSTKPTIFYSKRFDNEELEGYLHATASLQYNRHAFPYNTPFYATNRVRQRNPFFNSYSDFSDSLDIVAREYSILPEFRIADDIDYYLSTYFKERLSEELYSEEEVSILETQALKDLGLLSTTPNSPRNDVIPQGTKKRITRNFTLTEKLGASNKTKLDMLNIDGIPLSTSAAATSLSGSTGSTDVYVFDPLTMKPVLSALPEPTTTWAQDSGSVAFYESYSHTDSLSEFSDTLAGHYKNGDNTIPKRITFKTKAIKKVRPSEDFYPVLRSVTVGNTFKNFIYEALNPDTRTQKDIQAFLEPFCAPGILYNSIKSGIAVDHPIYVSKLPYYFCPIPFASGAILDNGAFASGWRTRQYTSNFLEKHVTSSFNYGGLYMMGASRCIPSILNSLTYDRLPFESLYNPRSILSKFAKFDSSLFLTTDFLSLDDCEPQGGNENVNATSNAVGSQAPHHPGYAAPLAIRPADPDHLPNAKSLYAGSKIKWEYQNVVSSEEELYRLSVNNFLSEMMGFFLEDYELPGVKLPIAVSQKKGDGDMKFQSEKTYYMEVSLRMGADQVICEGPRNAGIGGGSSVDNLYANNNLNASMRGYIYGPPMEIVEMSGSQTIVDFTQTLNIYTGELDPATKPEPYIASWVNNNDSGSQRREDGDYESYFGANLQDPAYQAYTPPYFYGESSMLFSFTPSNDEPTYQAVNVGVSKNSIYYEKYVTGSSTEQLCKVLPGTSSISMQCNSRMKIDSSVNMGFMDYINVSRHYEGGSTSEYVWHISPKWVCPVLDFSSSYSAVYNTQDDKLSKLKKSHYTLITNSFHDITTGRGLWGGYGTDPYDKIAQKAILSAEGKPGGARVEKGVYLEIKYPFTPNDDKTALTAYETAFGPDASGQYTLVEGPEGDALKKTGSFGDVVGFQKTKDEVLSYKIGAMAKQKEVSEAIVMIPYFEKPISIVTKAGFINRREIFSTREIIPGKHFLPIHNLLFENLLSMNLAERKFSLFPGDSVQRLVNQESNYIGFETMESVLSAKETDVYKMIDLLLGNEFQDRRGYELPPEFDFVNYNIDPFQMFVIPFEHTFSKQELIDIYQGIMPDSSMETKHVERTFTCEPFKQLSDPTPGWMPYFQGELGSLSVISPQNFLNSQFIQVFGVNAPGLGPNSVDIVDSEESINRNWLKTSRDFYKNIKFMTFKIKQKGTKDYDSYRRRQIERIVKKKVYNDIQDPVVLSNTTVDYSTVKRVSDVFGNNWPYDNFSLIESAKIDIELEVIE